MQADRISKDLKNTPARSAIMRIFASESKPLRAEDVYQRLKKTGINRVTVYRNLSAFERAGILNRLDLRRDAVYYESKQSHHHHLVCTACGFIEEFDNSLIEKEIGRNLKASFFRAENISEHSIEIFGLCNQCSG